MKKWNLVLIGLLLFSLTRMSAQDYYMTAPIGYGKAATGGGNATPTLVTNFTELSNALTASGPGVILLQGSIQIDYLSVLATNKTILGLPGSKLYTNDQTSGKSGILYFKPGTTNIIIRNVTFVGPGAYDSDGRDCLTFDGVTNSWVDHCDFQDGMDGNFDNKGNTDNITVTWCKFSYNKAPKAGGSGGTNDHRFTNLIGSSSSNYPQNTASDTQYSVTWQYCWWAEGCVERQVRARNAELHILNCYWNSSVANKCIGLEDGSNGKGTQCYVEGGVFETPSSTKNIDASYGGTPDVTVVDCIGNNLVNNSTAVSKPSYLYTALPSSSVKATLTNSCGAGATLNVTMAGVVSSACNSTPAASTLSLLSGSASKSVTVNSAISNIVYSFGGGATGATVTGLPAGITSSVSTSAKTVTISGIPTSVQSAAYTVSTVGGASTVSLNGTITTTNTVTNGSLALTSGSTNQSIILGNSIATIVYTYGGSATGARVTGLPAGVSYSVNTSAKTVTISGTPASAIANAAYTVTTSQTSGNTASLSGTITVATPVTLGVPANITASATQTSATINWGAVANATGYTVNLCSSTTTISNVVMLLNSTSATSTGVYTLNTGDQYKTSSSISTTNACSPTGYTNGYRSGSINDNILKLVNTTGVSSLVIGAKSSGSSARNLLGYTINGGTQIATGITQSGVATCGEYVINGVNLSAGDQIAFVFDGNVQISYFIAKASTLGTSTCTETNVTGTSYTATGFSANTSISYQVKATSTNPAYINSAYSTAATITTNSSTARYNVNESTAVAMETENVSKPEFKCYPTLVENEIQISLPETNNATITIFDLAGRKLMTVATKERNTTLNLSSLKHGIYIVSVFQNKNFVQRIIKK